MPRPTEARALSTAGGGTALTTALAVIPLAVAGKSIGRGVLSLMPRNQVTAVVVKYALTPRIAVLFSNDSFAALPTDNSDNAQDGATGTLVTVSALAPAPVGYLYVGGSSEFRGLQVPAPTAANAVASVMTAEYWNGAAWTTLAITDGSASGGATLAIAGNITWTIPAAAAWKPGVLLDINALRSNKAFGGGGDPATVLGLLNASLWWVRLKVSAALSATVTLGSLMALARSTAYAELPVTLGVDLTHDSLNTTPQGVGGIEALTDAGTASLVANLRGEFLT